MSPERVLSSGKPDFGTFDYILLEKVQDLARALDLDVLPGLERVAPGPGLDTGERFGYALDVHIPNTSEQVGAGGRERSRGRASRGRGGGAGGTGSRGTVLNRPIDIDWLDREIQEARERALSRQAVQDGLRKRKRPSSAQPSAVPPRLPLARLASVNSEEYVDLARLPDISMTPGEGRFMRAGLMHALPVVVPLLAQRYKRRLGSLMGDGNCLLRGFARAPFAGGHDHVVSGSSAVSLCPDISQSSLLLVSVPEHAEGTLRLCREG